MEIGGEVIERDRIVDIVKPSTFLNLGVASDKVVNH